ncbi:helix-turn-helix transcriptional regulator [Streptomyces sp. NBC_01795]|nr:MULTISPECIES: helix-turn-helix transcriptional regulator [unclassified Streptomyces]WSA90891.1 helix-turn-helix transcriptional regulator [Streptomyces sp. NBC_01795]WSB75214.1 helix-turn-helix transcriptional regulator [Streptomyces sp. NBC_01775]WSS16502.1 helix-turn-helix transcriptional regulator [Streptomyces sp. NBC_01186]WSS45319.1 helix-turn-helix transcriptional regulator [Streptomyces sp. NBC_01187]
MPDIRHTPEAPTSVKALAPGESIEPHRHDEHQLIYAGSGLLAITTAAGTWFAPGTRAIWVPAGCVHAHRAHGHLALHLLGLPAGVNPLNLAAPTVLAVSPLLRELILACTRGPHDDSPERRRLRTVLLDQLRASPQQPFQLPSPTDPRLVTVCGLLHRDPADPRTLAALATAAGAGERTLSRLFRRELGMTFPQWRTQLRLYHALRMLAEDTPVTTVAHRCGWASPSAFIDVFRQALGHTPGTHNHRPLSHDRRKEHSRREPPAYPGASTPPRSTFIRGSGVRGGGS